MSTSYAFRFAGLTAAETKAHLLEQLDRVGDLTSKQYEELVCDIGEYNARNPRSKIRVKEKP